MDVDSQILCGYVKQWGLGRPENVTCNNHLGGTSRPAEKTPTADAAAEAWQQTLVALPNQTRSRPSCQCTNAPRRIGLLSLIFFFKLKVKTRPFAYLLIVRQASNELIADEEQWVNSVNRAFDWQRQVRAWIAANIHLIKHRPGRPLAAACSWKLSILPLLQLRILKFSPPGCVPESLRVSSNRTFNSFIFLLLSWFCG